MRIQWIFLITNSLPSHHSWCIPLQAAVDLLDIIKSPQLNIPTLTYGDETNNTFIKIATLLKITIPPIFPKDNVPPPPPKLSSLTNNKVNQKYKASEPRMEIDPKPSAIESRVKMKPLTIKKDTHNSNRSTRYVTQQRHIC